MKNWIKVLLSVIITAGVVGYGTYYSLNKKATTDKNNLQAKIVGRDSQIAKLEKQLIDEQVSAIVADDNSALAKICQSAFKGYTGLNCTVTKIDGNYATGTASDPTAGAGANWYARKTSATWKLVGTDSYGFQDDPPCSDTVGFPKTIVPSCSQ